MACHGGTRRVSSGVVDALVDMVVVVCCFSFRLKTTLGFVSMGIRKFISTTTSKTKKNWRSRMTAKARRNDC
jgi:hypothetical protein